MPNPFWPTAQLVPAVSRVSRRLLPFTAHASLSRTNAVSGKQVRRTQSDAPHRAASSQGTPIGPVAAPRSEEHTSELQSLMRISYAFFCLTNKTIFTINHKYIKNNS